MFPSRFGHFVLGMLASSIIGVPLLLSLDNQAAAVKFLAVQCLTAIAVRVVIWVFISKYNEASTTLAARPAILPMIVAGAGIGQTIDVSNISRRIDEAVEASLNAGFTIGVISCEIIGHQDLITAIGQPAMNAAMDDILARLAASIRESDSVARVDQSGFVICIALLAEKAHLESVAQRLRAIVEERLRTHSGTDMFLAGMGLAMYPIDGYTGTEMFGKARAATQPALLPANTRRVKLPPRNPSQPAQPDGLRGKVILRATSASSKNPRK